MSHRPHTSLFEQNLPPAFSLLEGADNPLSLPRDRYVGVLVLHNSQKSNVITFGSGAEGHTATQVTVEGRRMDREVMGRDLGDISLRLGGEVGNVLIMPREALIDTGNEISRSFSDWRLPFNGLNHTLAIMRILEWRKLDGVQYNACISYFHNPLTETEEVVCAAAGDRQPTFIHIPLVDQKID